MFWNKKKELIIQKRINALYRKIETIIDTKTTAPTIFRFYNDGYTCCYEPTLTTWYGYILETKFGTRYLFVTDDELFYGEMPEETKFCYGTYTHYGNLNNEFDKIFNIKIKNSEVIIDPKPMIKLTPHEIDLAILEFEEAIEEKYQIAKTRKSKHEECIEYFSKESEVE